MATTTPFYQWSVPTSSDLVKNGATAIETLGDSVDDSLWNSGYGQAGKNRLINGDFGINQRQFTSVTATGYTFDRFQAAITNGGGTVTVTPQVFTPGTAPVAGYEATNYLRMVVASQTQTDSRAALDQNIEDVRTFAGQTITVSFYAKANSGTPNIIASAQQIFGTGGSATVYSVPTKKAISTSWARYFFNISVPSVSGKTIGAGSSLRIRIWMSGGSDNNSFNDTLGIQNNTFDIWGVQAEYGSKMTPFQTASGGSPQAELAMCQRYYYRSQIASSSTRYATGLARATTSSENVIPFPVTMRTAPTALEQSGTAADYGLLYAATGAACSAVPAIVSASTSAITVTFTLTAGLVAGGATIAYAVNTNGYLGWSAEF